MLIILICCWFFLFFLSLNSWSKKLLFNKPHTVISLFSLIFFMIEQLRSVRKVVRFIIFLARSHLSTIAGAIDNNYFIGLFRLLVQLNFLDFTNYPSLYCQSVHVRGISSNDFCLTSFLWLLYVCKCVVNRIDTALIFCTSRKEISPNMNSSNCNRKEIM